MLPVKDDRMADHAHDLASRLFLNRLGKHAYFIAKFQESYFDQLVG